MAEMLGFRLCVFHHILKNFPQTVAEVIEKKEKQKLNTLLTTKIYQIFAI